MQCCSPKTIGTSYRAQQYPRARERKTFGAVNQGLVTKAVDIVEIGSLPIETTVYVPYSKYSSLNKLNGQDGH